jgi:hypothetical protein
LGLKVSAMNPSFHKTAMTIDLTCDLDITWNALTAERRKEYGEGKELLRFRFQVDFFYQDTSQHFCRRNLYLMCLLV